MSFVWKVGLFPLDYFNHEMLPSSCYHLAALGLLAGPAEGDQPAPAPDTVHAGTQYSTAQYSTVQYSTMLVAVLALSGHLSPITHLAQSEERTGAQC